MPTLSQISKAINVPFEGDGNFQISGPAEPSVATEKQLALAMDKKFLAHLGKGRAKVAFLSEGENWRDLGLKGALFAVRPRYALSSINNFFASPLELNSGIHPTAIVHEDAIISADVAIGPFCVIGRGVVIKDGSKIYSHVTIGENTLVNQDCWISSGVRIGANTKIGDRFICHFNSVIGSDGFSFVSSDGGGAEEMRKMEKHGKARKVKKYERIASLGAVYIGQDVEIGANCCIDRGTISDTVIGNGSKLDNAVHIAHNVTIGENCLLCGQVGVAGSSNIEDRVVLGGQVGVADHIKIGHDTIVAGKSGVSSNVLPNQFMMGNPAMKMTLSIASYKAFRRLPRYIKDLKNKI